MKRFLKILSLLIVSLFFIASGLNAALDHYSHTPSQTSVSFCDEKGNDFCSYRGDLNAFKASGKQAAPFFLHRT